MDVNNKEVGNSFSFSITLSNFKNYPIKKKYANESSVMGFDEIKSRKKGEKEGERTSNAWRQTRVRNVVSPQAKPEEFHITP